MSESQKPAGTTIDSFASELIHARNKMGLSVSELHRQTGISRTVIQGYESGKYKPGARELKLICEALKITPNRLLFGTDTPFDEKGRLSDLLGDEQDAARTVKLTILFSMLSSTEKESFLNLMHSILEGRVGKQKIDEAYAAVEGLIDVMGNEVSGVTNMLENAMPKETQEEIGRAINAKIEAASKKKQ